MFIKFWYNLDTLESEEHRKAFLFKATKNQAIDELRKQQSSRRTLDQWKELKSWSDTDENQMEKLILIEKIFKAADLLPPKCREIFILHKKEGYSYKEIAEIKDLSIKTVENQMLIALKKLRELVSM